MADFVDFNNAAFGGDFGGVGDGSGQDMLFDDLFGGGGGDNNGDGVSPSSFVPPQIERQAVIFLIDCSVSMFAPQMNEVKAGNGGSATTGATTTTFYHTPFSKAVKFARDFCQAKVFTAEKDLTAVVLYNSKKPLNQYNFPSIFVFQEFNSPSAPQVQELDTLSRAGIFVQINDNGINTIANNNNNTNIMNAATRFNANTYEDFKAMIGHADADLHVNGGGGAGDGQNQPQQQQQVLLNPITGAPVQNQNNNPRNNNNASSSTASSSAAAASLSEVLWTCQHLFHFLKTNAQSHYVFTKHVMVFTDKENPVAAYAASRRIHRPMANNNTNNNANQQQRMEMLRRVLLEYERSESRIRDLHEDGVTVEVFGYAEDPSSSSAASNNNNNAAAKQKASSSSCSFNPKVFWSKFLNGPMSDDGELMSEEVRRVMRSGGPANNNLVTLHNNNNSNSLRNSGGNSKNTPPNSNSYSGTAIIGGTYQQQQANNMLMGSAVPSAVTTPTTVQPPQAVDWFSTLPKANHNTNSSANSATGSNSNTHNGPASNTNSLDHHGSVGHAAGGSSSVDGTMTQGLADELQNLPKGTVKVALGRVYPLSRPGPEGREKQSLHRQLDANLTGTADEQEELEHALMTEGMMMKTAYVRQHATRSVGSLLVTFGGNSAAALSSSSAASASSSHASGGAASIPTFAVKVYRPIVPMAKPKYSWRHSRTNEVLVTKTQYIDNTTGLEVVNAAGTAAAGGGGMSNNATAAGGAPNSSTLIHYAEVAGERACFGAVEKQQIRTGTFRQQPPTPTTNPDGSVTYHDDPSPPGIRVIGFKPYSEAVKAKYSLNRAVFIHPYATSSSGSSSSSSTSAAAVANDPSVRFFVGLHRTLTRRKMVAVAEMVSRRTGAPAMVLLVPSALPNMPDHDPSFSGVGLSSTATATHFATAASHGGVYNPTLSNTQGSGSHHHGVGGSGTGLASSSGAGDGGHGLPAGYLQGALAVDGCGFHVISLPYADDIRSMNAFKRFGKQCPATPSDSLITSAKKIIQKLSVTYFPDAITNPTLAHQYRQLQRLALGNDEMDDELDLLDSQQQTQSQHHAGPTNDNDNPANFYQSTATLTNLMAAGGAAGAQQQLLPNAAAAAMAALSPQEALRLKRRRIQDAFDVTLPHKEGMVRYADLFESFTKAAFPLGYNAEVWAPTPKPKAPGPSKDELDNIDFEGLAAADKLSSLTMGPLQAFLKLHNVSNTGKKAELIDRVKATIQKLQTKKAGGNGGGGGAAVKPEPAAGNQQPF